MNKVEEKNSPISGMYLGRSCFYDSSAVIKYAFFYNYVLCMMLIGAVDKKEEN